MRKGSTQIQGSDSDSAVDPSRALDPAWEHVARLAKDAGVAPGDPSRQPMTEARAANWVFNMFWNAGLPSIGRTRDVWLDGPAGPFRLRVFYPSAVVPQEPQPVILYFHGGGFVMNGLDTHERIMRLVALRSDAVVIGVGYHLAPEHRYPVQLLEARKALDWVMGTSESLGVDGERIGVAGDSAGATLALSLLIHLRDVGRGNDAKAGLLFYGMYGTDLDTVSHRKFGGPPFGLTSPKVDWFWRAYLPNDAARTDPLAVPALADVAGLAPLILSAAGLDCLRDDTVHLARRLAEAQVPFTIAVHDRLPHSFLQQSAFVPAAERALSAGATEIANRLRPLRANGLPAGPAEMETEL